MMNGGYDRSDMRYHVLLEKLMESMTREGEFDLESLYGILKELCVLLRVSKGVTTFYESPEDERRGVGENRVCYDSGVESVLVRTQRDESPTGLIVVCAVYQAKDAEPFSELERDRVALIQRMMVTIINRRRLQISVERMSCWDGDGYHNLRYFLRELIAQGRSGRLNGSAAFRLNLKHFSLINQQIGRVEADRAMKAYYHELEKVVGPTGAVGRLGGDNFVALCEQDRLPEIMEFLKGKKVQFCQQREAGMQDRVTIHACAGFYIIPDDYVFVAPDDIMDKIMSAYQAAKAGKEGDIVLYRDIILREKERLMMVQQRFNRALKDEEFKVYYQPKVDINARRLIGAEALCRWVHEGQIVPPMEFIPILERGQDICRLDFYMLDHVCRDIARWLEEGKPVVRVSVNLSRRHMMDPDLLEHILEIVDGNRVPHEYIEIELTETTTDVEFRDLKRVVGGLQAAGIYTSVDDFGVGYSSLNLIKEIPWNVLKLDKSLLPANEEKVRGSQMFKHVISMAHEIGMTCVAEGVETADQLKVLEDNGCRIAQGFYFDRPLPVEKFEERLRARAYEQ